MDAESALEFLCDKFGDENVNSVVKKMDGYACDLQVLDDSAVAVGKTKGEAVVRAVIQMAQKHGWSPEPA